MKTKFLLIFWLFVMVSLHTFAQIYFPPQNTIVQSQEEMFNFLETSFPQLQNAELQLKRAFFKRSPASLHYTFEVYYRQFPILGATVKVNTDLGGKILSAKCEQVDINKLIHFRPEDEAGRFSQLNFEEISGVKQPIRSREFKIDLRKEEPQLICQLNYWNKTFDKSLIINTEGEVIDTFIYTRYLKKDTLIHAHVFNPDPLTQIAQIYGAPYIDNNDQNLPWFSPAYVVKDIRATFETSDNTFYLETDLVIIEDFEAPNIPVVNSSNPDFYYQRNEGGFEQCNALYHISTFHDYIASLGYDTLMDIPITVDAQGMVGADNSMFNRNGGNPTLSFGTGGVDDAEDADVIVHEYSHALSWSANNNTFTALQRMGLDEGLADYFATSYSRAINPFNWQKMFTWDGHNEYWDGRTATTAANYPNGAGLYGFGEIWNAAMCGVWTDLGQVVTDKLMLEAMHFFTNNTTLPEAAIYIMQSDTLLFNGIHAGILCSHFKNKNILDVNCLPVPVKEIELQTSGFQIEIENTYGFSFLNQSARVLFSEPISGIYQIFDMSGKLLKEKLFSSTGTLEIAPENFSHGVYFIKVLTDRGQKVFKIAK